MMRDRLQLAAKAAWPRPKVWLAIAAVTPVGGVAYALRHEVGPGPALVIAGVVGMLAFEWGRLWRIR